MTEAFVRTCPVVSTVGSRHHFLVLFFIYLVNVCLYHQLKAGAIHK